MRSHVLRTVLAICCALASLAKATPSGNPVDARKLVIQIQRADYHGDRAELQKLFGALSPLADDKQIGSRVRYWRGFALWRRAFNGFNDSVDSKELEKDLNGAIAEFEQSSASDPKFWDPKIAIYSCEMTLMYLHMRDQEAVQAHLAKLSALLKELQVSALDNPRYYWVLGTGLWYRPEQGGGGQGPAFLAYGKGLEIVHAQRSTTVDPLEPSWGEPELLMNLAWSSMHRSQPDLVAAEKYAQSALTLVPDWHYVRDILLPQIREAKTKKS